MEQLREQLSEAQTSLQASTAQTQRVHTDFEQLRTQGQGLSQDFKALKDNVRETREQANRTGEAVRDTEKRLASLATLQEASKTTEERVGALNALAEHVFQKLKSLENQKHTIEHAVVESNRLSELVWNMDVQVVRLNEGDRQIARTEEAVDRIEKLARETSGQMDAALRGKEAFALDVARLERERTGLSDFMRTHLERLQGERKEFDAFDQRVGSLRTTLGGFEKKLDALAARERHITALTQKLDGVDKRLTGLLTQT